MIKLTEQEKEQLRASLSQLGEESVASGLTLTTEEYFQQLEQFARIMPRPKLVVFKGEAWRL